MPLAKADGANIYYEVIGQGDPLVLIQGYGHHLLHWGALPREFVKIGYQVVLLDNRGVGRSDKPDAPVTIATMADDVCKVMDAAGIGRAAVFRNGSAKSVRKRRPAPRPPRSRGRKVFAPGAGPRKGFAPYDRRRRPIGTPCSGGIGAPFCF